MITIENINSDIYLFGRNNKELYIKKTTKFKPYFYVEDDEGEFISLDNKKLKKVFTKTPTEVRNLRNGKNHHEADVIYLNRYIIDSYDKIGKEEIRIVYIDIETMRTENGYESPEQANNPINCIGFFDGFKREYIQFCLNINCKTEIEILKKSIEYIKKTNPDILIAWGGDEFDFPFLVNRIKKLKLNPKELSRINGGSFVRKDKKGFYHTHIFGRVCFDLMEGYKKLYSGEGRESWTLDYISKYEGVGEKEKYRGELDDLFREDINKFLSYNKRDVELLVLLNEKLGIINFFDEVRRLCLCRFEDVFMNSKMADSLCLKYAKKHGFVLPSCKENMKEKFEGAFVHDSEPKLHENIAWFDMKSLYPSVIIGFNISPECLLEGKEKDCIEMDNKYFFKKEQGIIPAIIKPLLEKRKEYKDQYLTQYALKVVANSFYGVLGMRYFRLYNNKCASAVTYIARHTIKEVHKWWSNKGFRVIYGDTDSCAIEMGESTIKDIINLNQEINLCFKEYFKQFNIEEKNNIFKLEFEKVFKRVFFKRKSDGSGAKKKYAGRIIWESGKEVDKFSITGFESKRSDSPDIGRTFMNDVLRMICYEQNETEISLFIENFKQKIKTEFTPEQIGLPIGISKPLERYKNQIHIRASRLANKLHNAQIKQGDKVKYIFIKNNPERVIAFKSHKYMWEGYEIDYEQMIRRIVDLKIGPLFESLGWEYNYPKKVKIISQVKEKVTKIKFKREEEFKQCSLI